MSSKLEYFALSFKNLEKSHQLEKTLGLLGRYKERLDGIGFYGHTVSKWLPRIVKAYPSRNNFPRMKNFEFGSFSRSDFPPDCIAWVVGMVSGPPRQPLTRLNGFGVFHLALESDDWKSMLEAIDLGMLDRLNFYDTNFAYKEFEVLVNRIVATDMSQVRLRTLRIDKRLLDSENARPLCTKLHVIASIIAMQ
ncbi:hypothetical protein BGZ65_010618 [Modicella reniformis]|uniref:Uncharacterized protein n=1 Tax=Modicella reniformis TaxID=1440133 RepID=A0A9P6M7P7_9FUNG|nr:hypothetical protein BGZ65_010618 [Modicella reniformis]